MATVKMKALRNLPMRSRWRQEYQTRMLTAGDVFEVPTSDVTLLKKTGWAEEARKRLPARPKQEQSEPESEPEPTPELEVETHQEDDGDRYEDLTVEALRALAEEKGIKLPPGYVKHDDLVALLKEAE